MESNWIEVYERLPKEGKVVETLSPRGIKQDLKMKGTLWFTSDGEIYVYYTPVKWRPKQK